MTTPSGAAGPPGGGAYRATEPLTLNGFAATRDQTIGLSWVDRRGAAAGMPPTSTAIVHNVRAQISPPTPPSSTPLEVHASLTPSPAGTRVFPWTVTLEPLSKFGLVFDMTPEDWIPQDSAARGLATSVGRIEIAVHSLSGQRFITNTGPASARYFDNTFVAFDNDGVGLTADPPMAWTGSGVQDVPGLGVIVEWGDYSVAGFGAVHGVMCHPSGSRPLTGTALGVPMRTVVLNHGAIYPFGVCPDGTTLREAGLMPADLDTCVFLAEHGWRVAMSAYRNLAIRARTDGCGSPQTVFPRALGLPTDAFFDQPVGDPSLYSEFCLGEVQDVLRWTEVVRQRPDVDTNNVLMVGGSHGGCITLRTIEQGAQVRAAVALSSPTDFPIGYAEELAYVQFPPPVRARTAAEQTAFINGWSLVYGADAPGLQPPHGALEARSPARMAYPDITRRRDVRLLFAAVLNDVVVHPAQSCLLAQVLQQAQASDPNALSSHYLTMGSGTTFFNGLTPAAGAANLGQDCSAVSFPSLVWSPTTGEPAGWPAQRYFLLYDSAIAAAPHDASPFEPMNMQATMAHGPIADFIASIFGPMT